MLQCAFGLGIRPNQIPKCEIMILDGGKKCLYFVVHIANPDGICMLGWIFKHCQSLKPDLIRVISDTIKEELLSGHY